MITMGDLEERLRHFQDVLRNLRERLAEGEITEAEALRLLGEENVKLGPGPSGLLLSDEQRAEELLRSVDFDS